MSETRGEKKVAEWFRSKGWTPAQFQLECILDYLSGRSGLLNAPTGSGKTYALLLPPLIEHLNGIGKLKPGGIRLMWITPLRALTKDLQRQMQTACDELGIAWRVGVRTGDISASERKLQKTGMPEILLITPESLHLLFAQKNNSELFADLQALIVDEWHELMGSKRGTQTELGISRLFALRPVIRIWGISATIGNLGEALEVLMGRREMPAEPVIVRSNIRKEIQVKSILPDKIEHLPWAGHLGINLLDKVMPVVMEAKTTLIFTNTRSQTEIWYRFIMEKYPGLAGLVALHHGSLDREIRNWVEENLHLEKLKLVICTSSLDLGVDFRPVETVVQVGSPKSVSRFLQRAGRSGHRPGAVSTIYFVPTHALELMEAVSLRLGVEQEIVEERPPVMNPIDVLCQYLVTLAVGEGFKEEEIFRQVTSTYSYQYLTRDEWQRVLQFITVGGATLSAYDDFHKVERENGLFVVKSRRIAMRHRLSMGTIVSDSSVRVQFVNGKYLGTVEENFASRLKPGDVFFFAGMNLEFVRLRDLNLFVRKVPLSKANVPRWAGGRIPLSSQLSVFLRDRISHAMDSDITDPEILTIRPLLQLQQELSVIPGEKQFLIEQCTSRDGYHIFMYPFEGRLVHEGMASLLAYRISRILPITFSLAMNDYGFELLSDKQVMIEDLLEEHNLFSTENLLDDIFQSVNANEMARRKFRDIASIAGLIFQGFPGKAIKARHIQASSSLMFEAIREHEPEHLLLRQAYQEALEQQLEETRLRKALNTILSNEVTIVHTERPSPFAFPIMVDRLREQISSELLEERVRKLMQQ